MNYTEYTTMSSVLADYLHYAEKMDHKGQKPVSVFNYMFGNVQ